MDEGANENRVDVMVAGSFIVPEGTKVVMAPTGIASGFLLPCGRMLKPQLVMELVNDGEERDLGENELNDMGVITDLDLDRRIDGELEEISLEEVVIPA